VATLFIWSFNPLDPRGNHSDTSNNMKLVHWPLMGGLLHLVQRGGDWAGCCEVAERSSGLPHKYNSGSGLVLAPILAKMGRSRPKFPDRCHPLTCPRIPKLVRIGCALPTYSGQIDFSAPKILKYSLSAYNDSKFARNLSSASIFVALRHTCSQ